MTARIGSGMGGVFGSMAAPLLGGVALAACVFLSGCGSGVAFVPAAVQSTPVAGIPAGPTLGYIWSSTDGTLRPMLGVLGSAVVGQTVVPAGTYVAGAASSASGVGLVVDPAGNLFALDLPMNNPRRVAGGIPAGAQIVFAPSGGTAIAYATGGASITLISALSSAQPSATTVSLPAGTKVASAAVSDAGTTLIATQTTPMTIAAVTLAGQYTRVASVGQVGGMNFLPGMEDALVADGSRNNVSLLHNVSGALAVQTLNTPGLNQPFAVAGTQDKRWALVADGGDSNLLAIDLKNGGTPTKLTCSCQATLLSALAGSGAFRVNGLGSGPVWTVDLSGTSPRMMFVPGIQ